MTHAEPRRLPGLLSPRLRAFRGNAFPKVTRIDAQSP